MRIYMINVCICIIGCVHAVIVDARCDDDYDTLLLTVEALKAQLEEQTRLCKEQVSLHHLCTNMLDVTIMASMHELITAC
jgi:hypothetical protein